MMILYNCAVVVASAIVVILPPCQKVIFRVNPSSPEPLKDHFILSEAVILTS